MFKTPVSTIRDVAELTDASPNLIARLLGEIRGPGEYEKLVGLVDSHEKRITQNEAEIRALKTRREMVSPGTSLVPESKSYLAFLLIPVLIIIFILTKSSATTTPSDLPMEMNAHGRHLVLRDWRVFEVKDGREVRVPDDDPDAQSLISAAAAMEHGKADR